MKRRWLAVAGLTLLMGFSGVQAAHAQFTFRSLEEEKRIGAETHPKVLEEFGGAYDDPQIGAYFATIAGRLAANSDNPQIGYTFTLLNSPVLNAFALPGGYVYITRMIVALANDEAEVAGVIGHEIGHVTARHGAQRETQGIFAGIGSVIAGIGGAILGVPELGQIGQVVGAAYVSKYSRDQEFEADSIGVRILSRTGYDPYAMSNFLASMGAFTDLDTRRLGGQPRGASLFDSHPRAPDRVVQAIRQAGIQANGAPTVRNREEYLRRIDGMLYGDDPREGLVKGRTFIHPDLRITFTVPERFNLVNQPAAVVAQGPGGAGIKFDLERDRNRAAADPYTYIERIWTNDGQTRGLERIDINGFPAATGTRQARTRSGQNVDVRLIAIQGGGGMLYRFLFVTPAAETRNLELGLRQTAYSFRGISAQEAAQVRPLRIRVHRVRSGETEENLARYMPDNGFALEHFRILNAVSPERPLRPGQLVKLVTE
ncbi:MAG: M48 family metalloprotease [Alphaproteobacteria bacterium]|nr:M48 family metalloprotease [Alphaproteobacteria bacterium]